MNSYDERLWIARNYKREGYIPNPGQTKKIFCKDCPEWKPPEACGNKELGCCMMGGNNSKADDYCEVEEDPVQ